jgi:hypothetical protein
MELQRVCSYFRPTIQSFPREGLESKGVIFTDRRIMFGLCVIL